MTATPGPYRFAEETIHLTNLRVRCIIGVNPEEREREQPLVITCAFRRDFAAAALADDLRHTVNYSDVAREIRDFARAGRFHLLETLVRRLGEHLCGRFGLTHLSLHVRKPEAVAESDGPAASLVITRGDAPPP
jgi:FolB domain-containing protein